MVSIKKRSDGGKFNWRKKFSFGIFVICLLEVVLWSMPILGEEMNPEHFADYAQRETENLRTYESLEHGSKGIENTIQHSNKPQDFDLTQPEEFTSGQDSLKNVPPASTKWNYLTWSVMTFLTFALGLAEKRIATLGEVSSSDDGDSGDSSDAVTPNSGKKGRKGSSKSSLPPLPLEKTKKTQKNYQNEKSELEKEFKEKNIPLPSRTDDEILSLLLSGSIKPHTLENILNDSSRAVSLRRSLLIAQHTSPDSLSTIPHLHYDYDKVKGKCCENVIGYLPIPIGIAGPLLINQSKYRVPMATTEGALVASTHRGCRALTLSGGVNAHVTFRGMTRGPALAFPSASRAARFKAWVEDENNFKRVKEAFESTSRFARLNSVKVNLAGRNAYVRFSAFTGDAMGMNMISKGVEKSMQLLQSQFPDMRVIAISGNFCTDKKPAAINWIEGRGRTVVADAVIKGHVVEKVLKTSVKDIVYVNTNKNLVGSAMAGSVGGFNAHAANIVTAIFLATGQDPAQNVESSNCMTLMESVNDGKDLYVSVTMPSIEVGTVGGGTSLPAQSGCLEMIGCKSEQVKKVPGSGADLLAQLVASAVLAGELSLVAALSSGDLVKSHLKLNRAKKPVAAKL